MGRWVGTSALTMDSTRISIARLLEADVPITWQDAVAVVQEVAMVSDVNAAMNNSPSLVTPEACFLTTAGEIDLPDTAATEEPHAVADLLRLVLRSREAPAALIALAQRRPDDLFGELAAFSSGPRRPIIARLAALALSPAPVVAAGVAATGPSRPPAVVALPEKGARRWAPMRRPQVATQPAVMPSLTAPSVAAAPLPAVVPKAAPPVANAPQPAAPDAELQRLRMRAVERDKQNPRRSASFARLLNWRAAVPAPRTLGRAAVVIAAVTAVATVVWRPSPPSTNAQTGSAAAPAASLATPAASSPASTAANAPSTPAPGVPQAPAVARRARRATGTGDAGEAAPPATTALVAPAPVAIAAPGAPMPPSADNGDATALTGGVPAAASIGAPVPRVSSPAPSMPVMPASAGRSARAVQYSANDPDVTPPVMLRQQLPAFVLAPGSEAPAEWPFLTVLVDERGTVERVRLHAKTPPAGQSLYRQRMLLAAAKAWQFEPARRQGAAVRYELRVPLEP